MRFIPTRIHGILDYLMGALLIAAPWLFAFNQGGAETWVPVIVGAAVIIYSLFTDYELGAVRKLSMPAHLMMDIIGGAFLAISPWLFGFADFVYLPHLILGIAEIGAGLFTKREPATHAAGTERATTGTSSTTGTKTEHNATIVPESRPPMGSKTDTRKGAETRNENERSRREREDLE